MHLILCFLLLCAVLDYLAQRVLPLWRLIVTVNRSVKNFQWTVNEMRKKKMTAKIIPVHCEKS